MKSTIHLLLLLFVGVDAFAPQRRAPLLSALRAAAEPTDLSGARQMIISGLDEQSLPETMKSMLTGFVDQYSVACEKAALTPEDFSARMGAVLQQGLKHGLQQPYQFDVTHEAMREPYDFYRLGCDFFNPLMDMSHSVLLGSEHFAAAKAYVDAGENVVFMGNHQSEADPQVLSTMLSEIGLDEWSASIMFVAGHKVTTDPLAIPFSMGRSLMCIHSKKHIDSDPELKETKQKQNNAAVQSLVSKFKTGGHAVWVAPSGGRDRIDRSIEPLSSGDSISNLVPPAPFDSKSVDMFRLIARKARTPTHFFPMAMVSYGMCPPPDSTVAAVNEVRNVRRSPVGVALRPEVDIAGLGDSRAAFSQTVEAECNVGYVELLSLLP